jgi:hypothetical protein
MVILLLLATRARCVLGVVGSNFRSAVAVLKPARDERLFCRADLQ